jgi:SAM-dependent methyltransferase
MNQSQAWEREYQNPKFLSLGIEPSQDVKDFVRFLRKQDFELEGKTVLDLGCGNGKNLPYLIERGAAAGIGYDISPTAIKLGEKLCAGLPVTLEVRSIGEAYPLADSSVDVVIDVMAVHALSNVEREVYSGEVARVTKQGGYLLVRTLALPGDKHAKFLIQNHPGTEENTYILPDVGVSEHVFTEDDMKNWNSDFKLISLEKSSGYQRWGDRKYKRNYWVAIYRRN